MTNAFAKHLSDWIDSVDVTEPSVNGELPDITVLGVCQDSRLCVSGDAYFALNGATTHGYRFAESAVENGAVVVFVSSVVAKQHSTVTESLLGRSVPIVFIDQIDEKASQLAAKFYGYPSTELKVVAVTGTDGKTSVCRFLQDALTQVGTPCGYIGTLGWGLLNQENSTALTTPDAVALQRMLATMQHSGAKAVALEASSHGIAEGRLSDINIDVAVLTNLGRDHLDYHVSEEAYREAKAALFRWPSLKAIVVNGSDSLGRALVSEIGAANSAQVHVFNASEESPNANHYQATEIVLNKAGLRFELIDGTSTHEIFSAFYGRFNVENMCACYAVLRSMNVSADDSADALQMLQRVPGRMEPFSEFAQPTVIVDYAHTPQALGAAIEALREHVNGRLWVVFGCGGDRDPGKRALMAQAAEAADEVIVTDDNPRTENPSHIRLMIVNGFSKPANVLEIGDRQRAIQYAIWHAQPDDVVLVAGKGHEDYQIVGNQVLHFSDRNAVQALLKEAG